MVQAEVAEQIEVVEVVRQQGEGVEGEGDSLRR